MVKAPTDLSEKISILVNLEMVLNMVKASKLTLMDIAMRVIGKMMNVMVKAS